jgi:hypothetical protein
MAPSSHLDAPSTPHQAAVALYADLLKRSLCNLIYEDDLDLMRGEREFDKEIGKWRTTHPASCDHQSRYMGEIWPSKAHTMLGIPRLDNIQSCVEDVLRRNVPGDLLETGVWRGGATIFMRGLLKAHGVTDRKVWVVDSFEGLPPVDLARFPKDCDLELDKFSELSVPLDEVRRNFEAYQLLDDNVCFLKGWFRDTLPTAPMDRLAIMHLDGDLYESTTVALVNLYDKLSPGGYIIVDDYKVLECCTAAVEDFRAERGITDELKLLPIAGGYWQKS